MKIGLDVLELFHAYGQTDGLAFYKRSSGFLIRLKGIVKKTKAQKKHN
jgi:hypothetical protein